MPEEEIPLSRMIDRIWIKASGIPLAGIDENGFVCLSREKLGQIEAATYSEDPATREEEVKLDMAKAIISPENLRPSVETSLHNLIGYAYRDPYPSHTGERAHVFQRCGKEVGEGSVMMPSSWSIPIPGLSCLKNCRSGSGHTRTGMAKSPQIIFLQNHGVFVGADTTREIRELYKS